MKTISLIFLLSLSTLSVFANDQIRKETENSDGLLGDNQGKNTFCIGPFFCEERELPTIRQIEKKYGKGNRVDEDLGEYKSESSNIRRLQYYIFNRELLINFRQTVQI